MSAIEETLARINLLSGVEGYVIVDNKGTILRHSKSLSAAVAGDFAHELIKLAHKARHVVRDLEPKARRGGKNDLEFFRLRSAEKEILCAPGDEFVVVVIQKWKPTLDENAAAATAAAAAAMASAAAGPGAPTAAPGAPTAAHPPAH